MGECVSEFEVTYSVLPLNLELSIKILFYFQQYNNDSGIYGELKPLV